MESKRPCRLVSRPEGCRFGAQCKFSHGNALPTTSGQGRNASRNKPRPEVSSTEVEFRRWRFMIPRDGDPVVPLGPQLSKFFQKSAELVESDTGTLQDVIFRLSSPGGLSRIRELADQDLSSLADSMKLRRFLGQHVHLFRTLANPDVLSSIILEQPIGDILICIYGFNGQRAVGLFSFTAQVLSGLPKAILPAASPPITEVFEATFLIFTKVIDLNGGAQIHQELPRLVEIFSASLDQLIESQGERACQKTRSYLSRIQQRLGVGQTIPQLMSRHEGPLRYSSFHVLVDPPGPFSPKGPRHDNDHADINQIKILPTWPEVQSLRPEYLPLRGPETWHKAGIQGLLDRSFRLLREDTVGQLRDAIQMALAHMQSSGSVPNTDQGNGQGLRTYTYCGVSVIDFSIDRRDGLRCEVAFAQPQRVRNMTASKRAEWWTKSRRLQPDALVSLFDCSGLLLFFSVVPNPPKPGKTSADREGSSGKEKKERNLNTNAQTAYITLNLVDFNRESGNDLFRRFWDPCQMALVEFPGVMLPAFRPTLEALQQMAKSGDVPFAEFLASDTGTAGVVHVPPPAYSGDPNFRFNLRTAMDEGKDLYLSVQGHFEVGSLTKGSSLDDAQAHAIVDSLTRSFAIIQGPPGTGKSYTGIALVKILLDNRKSAKLGPILCVCYTNHALDQLLEHLANAGIGQIIRVGSRSKSETLQPFMLREVAQRMDRTKAEKHVDYQLQCQLEQDEAEIDQLIATLSNAGSWSSVRQYLHDHSPRHHDELFGKATLDDEGFAVREKDPRKALSRWLHGGVSGSAGQHQRPISVLELAELTSMSRGEREKIHRYWVQRIRDDTQRRLVQALGEYDDRRFNYRRNRTEMDLRCLQQAHIIGITTSGLARNLDMLRRIRAKVMICEEAGEVLESHTLTAMLPSVEHAILIGDHQQLRPQIQRHDLGREHPHGEQYSLDVSLFERLVQPNDSSAIQLPFKTLETQRRMHPMISQLVRETLYPTLKDAPSTLTYPMVPGMKRRLFWFDHRRYEASFDDSQGVVSTSHTNDFEIDMALGLVSHLMKQGVYHAEDIAVLTPYLGQLHKLRAKLGQMWELILNDRDLDDLEKAGIAPDETPRVSKSSALSALKVATIDNFQGEEAKVVVISLVRSNKSNKCGFLKTSNRINVLLSRAQHGMYIIGNSETAGSVQMWADVLEILRTGENLGSSFELQCPRHPNSPIMAIKPEDFSQLSPEGGCGLKCDQRLRCGHSCINKCHSTLLHDAVVCLEPCPKPMKGCDHSCPRTCGVDCPERCIINIHDPTRILACGHAKWDLPCWQSRDVSTVVCNAKVLRTIPGCHHKVELPCHVDFESDRHRCSARCDALLPCGHACKNRCSACKTRENGAITLEDHGVCQQLCGRNYSTCRHSCSEICHGDKPCPLCEAPCEIFCSHSRCSKKCQEPCSPCAQQTCESQCPHSRCSLPCAAPCDWLPCSKRCGEMLACGHQCPSICGETCPDAKFCQTCATDSVKDMQVDYIEMLTYKEVLLDEDPCIFPRCGHIVTVANMDGHMDMVKHYDVSRDGNFSGLKPAPPFSNDELKACPTCRGPLRNISRYGRIIRRALLDESTKKFIVWSHNEYITLQSRFQAAHDLLTDTADRIVVGIMAPVKLQISGSPSVQCMRMKQAVNEIMLKDRYRQVFQLRNQIQIHVNKAAKEEQPFKKVYDYCQDARRRRDTGGSFTFDPEVLQTRAYLLGLALLIRCDLAILSDILLIWKKKLPDRLRGECLLDLSKSRETCLQLLQEASQASSPPQIVEALLFYAQYNTVERPFVSVALQEHLREEGMSKVDAARRICVGNPGSTNGMMAEVEAVETMLRASTFFSVVTSEERRAVLSAMASEFSGTGHWYYCENGHPFTIGECGMPMQETRCPQCGAAAGGRNHQLASGVQRADDLERELRELSL